MKTRGRCQMPGRGFCDASLKGNRHRHERPAVSALDCHARPLRWDQAGSPFDESWPPLASLLVAAAGLAATSDKSHPQTPPGNRLPQSHLEFNGVTYRFQIYLPEEFRRDDHKHWPILLFLHGRGERGAEGMWQTQIGLPEAVRDHPERWPFIIVMPQCPRLDYWTDPDMMAMAMAALDQETAEFHADPARTYLTGLSLGGYGAWELARLYPNRWAAIAIAAGGVFWSYAPERWHEATTLARRICACHGPYPHLDLSRQPDDPSCPCAKIELMYDAFKAYGGHIRYWVYQGLQARLLVPRAYASPSCRAGCSSHRLDPNAGASVVRRTPRDSAASPCASSLPAHSTA